MSALEEAISHCPVCKAALTQARCTACGAAVRPGGYSVQRLIAKTPHSRVYLAQGPGGQQVALKELLFAQVPGSQEIEAFEREARLLETISHPHIPRLLGHFQEGQGAELRLYLAAEHISGETLLEHLGHHTFSEAEARDIGVQVLEILEYLHGRKPRVLHRDIKPANLIRQPDGTLFLVDFGAARESVKGATVGSTLVGTFGYMPLEQFGGTVDITSDLYALGATLVHLLGRTPPAEHFQPDRGLDVSHLEAPVLGPWLRKLTALRPEDRYRSAKLARQALEALQPSNTPARVQQTSPEALSANAPAALARLAQEAQAAREATSKAQLRQQQELDKEEREEARRREREKAFYEDDRLSLMDFYRMSCTDASSPAALPWIGLFIAALIYAPLALFELVDLPAFYTPNGLLVMLGVLLTAYVGLASLPTIRAFKLHRAFKQLPFTLEGLGRLVHRGNGALGKFTRCSLRLQLKEQGASGEAAKLVKTTRSTALQVAVDRANAALAQATKSPAPSQEISWKLQGDKAEGYANWRVGGQLLAICSESFGPLQRELGVIQRVIIEPSNESFTLSTGD
ncbi:MAG TPA: serine/threonine-protein kinase [Hyalangium sp.]|nr:serine/threonine-protein kinase [Hyalangium sp.]